MRSKHTDTVVMSSRQLSNSSLKNLSSGESESRDRCFRSLHPSLGRMKAGEKKRGMKKRERNASDDELSVTDIGHSSTRDVTVANGD